MLQREVESKIRNHETQLEQKASKTEIFTMANMGQDIRESMTGKSVAVVGGTSVFMGNLSETIQQDIGEVKNIDVAITIGGRYVISGSIVSLNTVDSASTNYRYSSIDVASGDFLIINNLWSSTVGTYSLIFADSNNNVVSSLYNGTGVDVNLGQIKIYVPNGASKIYLSSYARDISVEKRQYVSIAKKEDIDKKLFDNLGTFLPISLELKKGSINYIGDVINGFGTQSYWDRAEINCIPNDEFLISIRMSQNTSARYIFFANNDNKIIKMYDLTSNTVATIIDYKIICPLQATKLYVGTYNTGSIFIDIKKRSIDNTLTIINNNNLKTKELDTRVLKLEDTKKLPSYYDTHIQDKITQIRKNTQVLSGVSFAYFTDVHFSYNTLNSKKILKQVLDNTSITDIMCGGDFVVAYGDNNECEKAGYMLNDYKKYLGNRLFTAHGNHDFTIRNSSSSTTGKTLQLPVLYDFNIRSVENIVHGANGKLYYYIDNPIQKTRYFFVDDFGTSLKSEDEYYGVIGEGVTQEQMDWLITNMTNVDNYKFVIFTHAPIDSSVEGFAGQIELFRLFSFFNQKQNVDYSSELSRPIIIRADFRNTTNEVICCISGHNHKDRWNLKDNLLSITTTSDAYYSDDGIDRTVGTINENAIDIFTIDFDTRKIKTVRIGAGSNREFSY